MDASIIIENVGLLLFVFIAMKGTSTEILEWLTHRNEYAPLLQMSRQRLVGLRHKLSQGTISESRKEEILERLKNRIDAIKATDVRSIYCSLYNVRKVRNGYVLPAIVRDHHGKFYNEATMIKMVEHEEKMRDLNLDMVCRAIKRGDLPSKEVVREVLNRKGWNLFEEREVLPSIWEVADYS